MMERKSPICILLPMVISLFLATGLCGCQNDDYPEKVVQPDDIVRSRYSSFFNSETSRFFTADDHDRVYVIDSQEDLRKYYKGGSQLPQIGLNGNTLILGKLSTKDVSCSIENRIFKIKDVVGTMHVELYPLGYGGWPEDEKYVYFWDLYPKKLLDKVNVKKVYLDNPNLKELTETSLFGKNIPVKRVKRSSLPSWLVEKISSLSAEYAYEGKWNKNTVYVIESYRIKSNYDPNIDFLIAPPGTVIFDSKGNTITDNISNELTDLKCIYYASHI